jgi:hypothetical protein
MLAPIFFLPYSFLAQKSNAFDSLSSLVQEKMASLDDTSFTPFPFNNHTQPHALLVLVVNQIIGVLEEQSLDYGLTSEYQTMLRENALAMDDAAVSIGTKVAKLSTELQTRQDATRATPELSE